MHDTARFFKHTLVCMHRRTGVTPPFAFNQESIKIFSQSDLDLNNLISHLSCEVYIMSPSNWINERAHMTTGEQRVTKQQLLCSDKMFFLLSIQVTQNECKMQMGCKCNNNIIKLNLECIIQILYAHTNLKKWIKYLKIFYQQIKRKLYKVFFSCQIVIIIKSSVTYFSLFYEKTVSM
jgi:hypothetical protein